MKLVDSGTKIEATKFPSESENEWEGGSGALGCGTRRR